MQIYITKRIIQAKSYLPPIKEKGEIFGDIRLIIDFNFNEEVLYQEYRTRLPDRGSNKRLCHWHGQSLIQRDQMCSWILNIKNELIFRSSVIPYRRTECPNIAVELIECI